MAINSFDPVAISPGEDGYELIYKEWYLAGKPRNFPWQNVHWMQTTDERGVFFVPTRPTGNDAEGYYSQSSFKHYN